MTNIPNTAPPEAYGKDSDEWSIRVLLPAARLEHFIVRKQAVEPLSTIAVIDTETTGTDPARDQIIDLAYVILRVDAVGDIIDVIAARQALCDPGMPIPSRVRLLTGLTDADVRGKSIDLDLVEQDFGQVDV